jgi:hypothetical protein
MACDQEVVKDESLIRLELDEFRYALKVAGGGRSTRWKELTGV